jgi:hypothetical protein
MDTFWLKRCHVLAVTMLLVAPAVQLATPRAGADARHPHPAAEVPGSHHAAIFSPVGALGRLTRSNMAEIQRYLGEHRYQMRQFVDLSEATDDVPSLASAATFRRLSGLGVVFIATRGDTDNPLTPQVEPNVLLVEAYNTARARDVAFVRLEGLPPIGFPFPEVLPGEFVTCDQFVDNAAPLSNPIFGICITEFGVKRHFRDDTSIVVVIADHSLNFRRAFDAKEFFGYAGAIPLPSADLGEGELLASMLHGEGFAGQYRAAKLAYQEGLARGLWPAGFSHAQRAGATLETVLSPAVADHDPAHLAEFVVPARVVGEVRFDARMDTSVNPRAVLRASGCGAGLSRARWVDEFLLRFNLDLTRAGPIFDVATLTLRARRALGERTSGSEQMLDGNQLPVALGGTDHIGPNGDDYQWEVLCVPPDSTATVTPAAESPSATLTSTDTRTGTLTPTATGTATPSVTLSPSPNHTFSATPTHSWTPTHTPPPPPPATATLAPCRLDDAQSPPVCGGTCPGAGDLCLADATGNCSCVPPGQACADQSGPGGAVMCGGACARPGDTCALTPESDACACAPTACMVAPGNDCGCRLVETGGRRLCAGTCPVSGEECRALGYRQSCQCQPIAAFAPCTCLAASNRCSSGTAGCKHNDEVCTIPGGDPRFDACEAGDCGCVVSP